MIEAQCPKCGTRYQPGTDHKCPASKKAASAAASSHRLDAKSGELPSTTSKGQASSKKGAATKAAKKPKATGKKVIEALVEAGQVARGAIDPAKVHRRRGRPASITDMAEYKRQKQVEYRQRKAAELAALKAQREQT